MGILRSVAINSIVVAIMASFVMLIALSNGALVGYPFGVDSYGHISKVRFILLYWPNAFWGNIWTGGMPFFRWYSPLPYYAWSLIAISTWLSIESSLILFFIGSMIAGAFAVSGCIRALGGRRAASIAGGLSYSSSSMLWLYAVGGGIYPRIISYALVAIFMWCLLAYLKSPSKSRKAGLLELISAFVLSLTVASHLYVGLESAALLVLLAGFTLRSKYGRAGGFLKIAFLALMLSACFTLPFVTSVANQGLEYFIGTGVERPTSVYPATLYPRSPIFLLNFLTFQNPYGTFAVPIAASIAVIALGLCVRYKSIIRFGLMARVYLALSIFALVSVLYFYFGANETFLHLFPIVPVSILLGLSLHGIETVLGKLGAGLRRLSVLIPTLVLLVLIFSTYTFVYPMARFSTTIYQRDSTQQYGYAQARELLADQTDSVANFRFGAPTDAIAPWFNAEFPNVPQTRDYEATSILNKDFIYWFEVSTWGGLINGSPYSGSSSETRFLMDWYSVKWFLVYPPVDASKFSSDPAFRLEVQGNASEPNGYVYSDATPIITYTTAPAILVVGEKNAYNDLFKSLAYSDFDSRAVVPVYGGKYVDELNPTELNRFPALVLYGYDFHDRDKAHSILADYVRNGGGLLLETGFSPESQSSQLPEPFPIKSTISTDFGLSWKLTGEQNSSVLDGVQLDNFSPAAYSQNHPWAVSASSNESVQPWASVLLWDAGRPILAVGDLGKGRVAWSGLNLPFHTVSYYNSYESRLMGNLIAWTAARPGATWSDATLLRPDPQHATISLSNGIGGVLFKEFYFQGWKAFISHGGSRQEVPIYQTGPGFMYVSAKEADSFPSELSFEYGPTWDVLAGYVISALFGVLVVLLALFPTAGRNMRRPGTALGERIRNWWYRD